VRNVVKAGPLFRHCNLWPELSSHERVQHAIKNVPAANDPLDVQTKQVGEKCRIDDLPLWLMHEPAQSIRHPRRHIIDHEQPLRELVVRVGVSLRICRCRRSSRGRRILAEFGAYASE
jgi:hypothetical protein